MCRVFFRAFVRGSLLRSEECQAFADLEITLLLDSNKLDLLQH